MIDKCTEVFVNYSSNAFEFLMKAGMGIFRTVHEYNIQKSLGVSSTLPDPVNTDEGITAQLSTCAKELAARISDCRLVFRCMTLELKTTNFELLQ